ncbi:MliC family protein [Verticiella sediminum]|nr:MliC family protein [Verticiella sediminum]
MPCYRALAGGGVFALGAVLAGCANPYHDTAVSPTTPGASMVGTAVAPMPAPASGSDGGDVIESSFQCGPQTIHTRYSQASDQMTLRVGDAVFPLAPAIAASGARYTGSSAQGPIEFWNRGKEARLTVGTYSYPTCVER